MLRHEKRVTLKPRKFDKPDRPFSPFRKDAPRPEGDRERPFRKPFPRDSRPDFGDEEQYSASGELADIVGTHPLDRREILRRMWRHYQDAGLVKSTGFTRRPPRDDRPPRHFEDRPPRRFERDREAAPHRFERKPEEGERRFSRKPSDAPRTPSRRPSGKHPAGRRAETLSKVPRRKFKDTREQNKD